MRFVFEVDLDLIKGDAASELGRALRYWGGATKQLELGAEQRQDIYDSSHAQPIGHWELRDGEASVSGKQHDLDQ